MKNIHASFKLKPNGRYQYVKCGWCGQFISRFLPIIYQNIAHICSKCIKRLKKKGG